MKYSRKLTEEMAAWVAEHGLVEYGGALLKNFCDYFAIDNKTYYNWLENSDFSDAIKKAKEKWKSGLERDLVLSMADAAKGYDAKKVQTRKVPSSNPKSRGRLVLKERLETVEHVAPNVTAGIFLLKNLNPERWKDRQQQEHSGSVDVNWVELLKDAEGVGNEKNAGQ